MLLYVILFYVKCRPYTDMTLFCHSSVLVLLSRLFTWIYWSIYIPLGDLFPPRPSFFPFFSSCSSSFVVVVVLLLLHRFLLAFFFFFVAFFSFVFGLFVILFVLFFLFFFVFFFYVVFRLHLHRSRIFLRHCIRLDLMM